MRAFVAAVRKARDARGERRDRALRRHPTPPGHFGPYGGRFVPGDADGAAARAGGGLRRRRGDDPAFRAELRRLLRDFVGRPTPLTYAARLSERLGLPRST